MAHKSNAFSFACALILLIAAFFKVVAILRPQPILQISDGVFGIKMMSLIAVTCAIEIASASLLLSGRHKNSHAVIILWLGTSFALYRGLKSWLNPSEPCACLGRLTESFSEVQPYVPWLLNAITAFFIIGSIVSIRRERIPKL